MISVEYWVVRLLKDVAHPSAPVIPAGTRCWVRQELGDRLLVFAELEVDGEWVRWHFVVQPGEFETVEREKLG